MARRGYCSAVQRRAFPFASQPAGAVAARAVYDHDGAGDAECGAGDWVWERTPRIAPRPRESHPAGCASTSHRRADVQAVEPETLHTATVRGDRLRELRRRGLDAALASSGQPRWERRWPAPARLDPNVRPADVNVVGRDRMQRRGGVSVQVERLLKLDPAHRLSG